jgi:hypothetical protein
VETVGVGNALNGVVALVTPPAGLSVSVDWDRAERELGTRLPDDYKALVEAFGAGEFDRDVYLLIPHHENRFLDLLRDWPVTLDALRGYVADPNGEDLLFSVEDGAVELLVCAGTGNGDRIFWVTREADPNDWTVAAYGMRDPYWDIFDGSLTEYLAHWLAGGSSEVLGVTDDVDVSAGLRFQPYL